MDFTFLLIFISIETLTCQCATLKCLYHRKNWTNKNLKKIGRFNSYIDSNLISFNRFVVYCIIASNQFSFWKYQYVASQIARKNNYILRWLNLKMNSVLLKKKIQKITVKNSVKSKEKLIFSWSFQGQKSAVWLLFIILSIRVKLHFHWPWID